MTIKYRETSATVFKLEQEVDKYKTELETIKREHARLKDRYSDVTAKRELAEGRLKDSNEEHLSCTEAMRRMKQYNEDTMSEQRMKIERLENNVSLEKEKTKEAEMSRKEVKNTQKVAENAAIAAANQHDVANQLKAQTQPTQPTQPQPAFRQ